MTAHAHTGNARRPGPANGFIRFLAQLLSFVFHPVFLATYVAAFLIFIHPTAFSGLDNHFKLLRLISVFFSSTFLPLFSVFLLWRLRFIPSMRLQSARDRIIPYVIVMVFYFWIWYVSHNQEDSSPLLVHFLLGSFLAVCADWMCNIFFKISMHATGMGGLLMFFILFSFSDSYASGLYLSIAVLITGLICTARFLISDHNAFEIYSGLIAGMIAQAVAWLF